MTSKWIYVALFVLLVAMLLAVWRLSPSFRSPPVSDTWCSECDLPDQAGRKCRCDPSERLFRSVVCRLDTRGEIDECRKIAGEYGGNTERSARLSECIRGKVVTNPVVADLVRKGPSVEAIEYYRKMCLGETPQPSAAPTSSATHDVLRFSTPSGHMGDGEFQTKYVQVDESWPQLPHSPPASVRVTYRRGPKGWATMCWQNRPDNDGDMPGTDLAAGRYTRISFWVRGDGSNNRVEFSAGGFQNDKRPHSNSFEATTGKIALGSQWRREEIDIRGKALSSVIRVFCWSASLAEGVAPLIFYLDDITYEQ